MNTARTILTLLIAAAFSLRAGVTLDLSPREISMDETARLTLKIEGTHSGRSPSLDLPRQLSVRSTGRNHVTINQPSETVFVYELAASEPGEYTLGPFILNVRGESKRVGPVTLTVKPARVIEQSDEVFLQFEADSERVLIHQPVELTLTIFSRYEVNDIQLIEFEVPGLQLGDWQSVPLRDREINGQRYRVRRFVNRATPARSGTLELAPVFGLQVLIPDENVSRRQFGMFSRPVTRRRVRLQADPVTLEAQSPPTENRPPDFDGAVGSFALALNASPREVRVGEPVTVRIQLEGRGTIQNILPPSFEENDDFQVFSAKLAGEEMSRDGSRGRRIMEQVLVPKHAEVEEIPEIRFSFFDPSDWRYETLSAGPISLHVDPQPAAEITGLSGPGTLRLGTGPAILGDDLMYLRTRPGRHISVPGSPVVFWSLSSFPLLGWAVGGLLLKRSQTLQNNPQLARKLRAPAKLRKQLAAIDAAEQPHEAMWSCLAEFLGNRFQIPAGEITGDRIEALLESHLSPEMRTRVADWLSDCERARFSGSISTTDESRTPDAFRAFMLDLLQEAGR